MWKGRDVKTRRKRSQGEEKEKNVSDSERCPYLEESGRDHSDQDGMVNEDVVEKEIGCHHHDETSQRALR